MRNPTRTRPTEHQSPHNPDHNQEEPTENMIKDPISLALIDSEKLSEPESN